MFDKNVHDDASFEQKSTKLSGAKLRRNNLVAENSAAKSMFAEGSYENRGKEYRMSYMNRDGFTLLAMGAF